MGTKAPRKKATQEAEEGQGRVEAPRVAPGSADTPPSAKDPVPAPHAPRGPGRYNPDLAMLLVPIGRLREDPKNARLHGQANLDAVQRSLEAFGQQKPVVVAPDGTIVAGNGTFRAAKTLGWRYIACTRTTLEGSAATAYALADNRTAELATWDYERLAAQLGGLEEETLRAAAGFDGDAIRMVEQSARDQIASREAIDAEDPGAGPLLPDAVSRRGEVYALGPHRLLCGDAASANDLDHLLAGAPVHLVNTDPPYNINVEPRSNNAIAAGLSSLQTTHHQKLDLARHPEKAEPTTITLRAKDRPIANDLIPHEEFERLLRAWFGNLARVLLPGRSFYVWGGYSNYANYPPALSEADLYCSQVIVWDKQHPVLTRKDFMGCHESCFYGWKKGAAHEFFGPNNALDLWHVKKVNHQSMIHLTEKPVELARRAIEYSSKRGEHVLDLFGGSGSTLIGAEMTGRRAYLMELDQAYCDVIRRRWTGYACSAGIDPGPGALETVP